MRRFPEDGQPAGRRRARSEVTSRSSRSPTAQGRFRGAGRRRAAARRPGRRYSPGSCLPRPAGRWSGRGTGHGRPPRPGRSPALPACARRGLDPTGGVEPRGRVRPLVGVGDGLRRSGGRWVYCGPGDALARRAPDLVGSLSRILGDFLAHALAVTPHRHAATPVTRRDAVPGAKLLVSWYLQRCAEPGRRVLLARGRYPSRGIAAQRRWSTRICLSSSQGSPL
jgi:hypothetical protein